MQFLKFLTGFELDFSIASGPKKRNIALVFLNLNIQVTLERFTLSKKQF